MAQDAGTDATDVVAVVAVVDDEYGFLRAHTTSLACLAATPRSPK